MPGLDWLTARPVAHRGLHDSAAGRLENTSSAFAAALADDYAIETDLQVSADGEAMVHHDDVLGRLTEGEGRLEAMTAASLRRVSYKASADRMQTLGELCDQVAGRVTLLLELKSHFAGDRRLISRVVEVLQGYAGPVAVMSFDPEQIEAVHGLAPGLPRGMVAERSYRHPEWSALPARKRRQMATLSHALRTRPHFLAYCVGDLPALPPLIARYAFGLPLLTWTVRNAADLRRARWADQIIFEGFRP